MIRRLKADVLSELPAKRRQKIEVQVDPKLKKEVEKILNAFDSPGEFGDFGEEETANTGRLDHFGIKPISFDEAFDDMREQEE
jgi:SNF2 family DNA or RNA helicase